eukprot:1179963-Prorocentrum_minimum.AAC.1
MTDQSGAGRAGRHGDGLVRAVRAFPPPMAPANLRVGDAHAPRRHRCAEGVGPERDRDGGQHVDELASGSAQVRRRHRLAAGAQGLGLVGAQHAQPQDAGRVRRHQRSCIPIEGLGLVDGYGIFLLRGWDWLARSTHNREMLGACGAISGLLYVISTTFQSDIKVPERDPEDPLLQLPANFSRCADQSQSLHRDIPYPPTNRSPSIRIYRIHHHKVRRTPIEHGEQ